MRLNPSHLVAHVVLASALALSPGCNAPPSEDEEAAESALTGDCASIIHRPDKATLPDLDRDLLPDEYEECLLQKHSPIYRLSAEKYLPANVDWFLARSQLRFHHGFGCGDCDLDVDPVQQNLVSPRWRHDLKAAVSCHHHGPAVDIERREIDEDNRYFLELDTESYFTGSANPADWTVYGHVYRSAEAAVNVQYWAFFAYSDGHSIDNHEGDWENITIQLGQDGQPRKVSMAAHGGATPYAPERITWSRGHPHVYVAQGTHASYPDADVCSQKERGQKYPTPGCLEASRTVRWYSSLSAVADDAKVSGNFVSLGSHYGGRVINVGELKRPLNGQVFINSNVGWGEQGSGPDVAALKRDNRTGPTGPTFGTHWIRDMLELIDVGNGRGEGNPEKPPEPAQCLNACPGDQHNDADCNCVCDREPTCEWPETKQPGACVCQPNSTTPPPGGVDWR